MELIKGGHYDFDSGGQACQHVRFPCTIVRFTALLYGSTAMGAIVRIENTLYCTGVKSVFRYL